MTPPTPLPRRYERDLREVMEEMQGLARHCRTALESLSSLSVPPTKLERTLLEMEARLYRLCTVLLNMETSAHCDACPHQQAAPLLLCAQQLEELARYLRSQVPAAVNGPGRPSFSANGIVEIEPDGGSAPGRRGERSRWTEGRYQGDGRGTAWP